MKLDKKDLQILGILDWNGRMPVTQIAKKVKLNKDVVKYRITNLEEKGIIRGYYAIINTHELGYMTVRIYFDFVGLSEENEKKIIDYLGKKFDASQIFSVEGDYELGIIIWEKSVYALSKKLNEFRNSFGKYINKENLSILMDLYHYPRKFLSDNFKPVSLNESPNLVSLKESDMLILSELSKNARITSIDLSYKLKIPQTTVIHRIKELEKKGILLGYRAMIDVSKLGYENYFLRIYVDNLKEIDKISNLVKENRNCIYSLSVLSGADLEIETEFEKKSELLDFIKLLKEKFKSIKTIKYWSTIKYYKINYFPSKFR